MFIVVVVCVFFVVPFFLFRFFNETQASIPSFLKIKNLIIVLRERERKSDYFSTIVCRFFFTLEVKN